MLTLPEMAPISRPMSLRPRILPAGTHRAAPFCIRQTPGTQGWPHENRHDGFRVIVKDFRQRIRFITRAIPAATNSHELIRDIEREHAGGGFIEPCLPTSSKQPSSARADRVLRSNPGMAQFRSATSANKRHSLVEEVAHHVMAAEKLHADDTPVPVLAPGTGKTKTARLWVYLRDERPYGGRVPPAVVYRYSPDRKGEHPRAHLAEFPGLSPDGYSGFGPLYGSANGQLATATEVACWAHVRRKFYDIHVATSAPIAGEALQRIGQLFDIERTAMARSADERRRIRQLRARPVIDDLAAFLDASLSTVSGRSELAGAIRHARSRWSALTTFGVVAGDHLGCDQLGPSAIYPPPPQTASKDQT